jgi:hypothetical protein
MRIGESVRDEPWQERPTMPLDWQLATAILVVLAATVLIVRRVASLVSGGSGGCGSCASKGPPTDRSIVKPLVTLDDSPPRNREPRA